MLKRLAIICLLLTCLPIHRQKERSKPNTEQNRSEPIQQNALEPLSFFVVTFPAQPAAQRKGDGADNHSDTYLHHLILPETLASIGLLIVGIIGTRYALRTLKNIERQTAAGEKAADAARLNAQAVINAERPWILVTIESVEGPMGGFNIRVRNRGRTPAMITVAYWGCAAVKEVTDLPREPSYWPRKLVKDRIVMPDGAAKIWWFDPGTLHNMLKEDFPRFTWEGQVFVFGTVLYRDLADPSPASIHETRWIGLYQPVVGDLDYSIFRIEGIGVADEYHRYS